MLGKITFTDKNHELCEREIFVSQCVPGAETLQVSDQGDSGFMGFGVAITPSSCYELSLMDPLKRRELLRQIYSKDGLGLSVGRICIGSSDYSPEIYSYDDHPFDTSLEHFSVERDEKYIIPMIKEILEINPDIYLFASPWSPPGWMKTGGSMCGGYMREKYVDCYADYIIKFIKAYAAYGIHISAITPQNEPETQQSGQMPACIWHPEIEARFIKLLRQKINEESLDVKIWMFDHSFNGTERVLWSLENCEGLAEDCDGVAFHYYGGVIEQTKAVKEAFPKLALHFTEGGPRLTDHYDTDWCKWGLMIIKALQIGYHSFTGWNLMLDETGGPNVGPFMGICGGLVTRDSQNGELNYSGQYKAFSHIAPYITPQSRIYPISSSHIHHLRMSQYPKSSREIEGVLIDNQDGKKIAVIVNPNSQGCQTQIEINGKLWYAELYPNSIFTMEIET
ncbi:MAG: hypothetical protein E7329_08630 [Clostridiales bacterium]|nr:hypothetical protein [Clostridiales bacterium]